MDNDGKVEGEDTEMARVRPEGLNLREAATYLGVSENTLRKMVKVGTIPCLRIGRKGLRFSRKVLEEKLAGGGGRPAA